MERKKTIILVIFVGIILTLVYTMASTYAVLIEVKEEEGILEIVNIITIRDLVTNDNGTYNKYYYDILKELDITDIEATLLIESKSLNKNLKIMLTSIADYNLNKNYDAKLKNNEILNLISDGLLNTGNISEELREKVIDKSNLYIQDISEYLYDIDVTLVGE